LTQTPYFLDDRTFAAFQVYVYELTGIHYTDSKRYLLDSRIKKRAQAAGLDGRPYYDFITKSPASKRQVEELIDDVSTNETSFFRHKQQIDAFQTIVAELIAERQQAADRSLFIWSAACSSGEEAYTLAMIVQDLLAQDRGWRIKFKGTDISPGIVSKAQSGRYSRRATRNMPEKYEKYLVAVPGDTDHFEIAPELRKLVDFEVLSLLDKPHMDKIGSPDIIFCRNVLIYFDDEAKRKVLKALWDSLVPGGYLVLGPSESLLGVSDDFIRTPHSVHNFFRRPEVAVAKEPGQIRHGTSRKAVAVVPANTASTAPAPTGPAKEQGKTQSVTFREKMLIDRLDRGLKNLDGDLDGTLTKIVDAFSAIGEIVENLGGESDRPSRSDLAGFERHIARILLFLQVGDRAHQKIESLRATVQELSDRLLEGDREAPDLRVATEAFDENILSEHVNSQSASEDASVGDASMSQDDIDALFE
jgi:chemotaxis protein methyltransferase CheR